jgi:hypothetical protein
MNKENPSFPFELENIIASTVKKTLLELGLDTTDPIEIQKDFAHLRGWREGTEEIKRKGFLTVVGVVAVGSLGLFWTAFKASLH